MPTRPATWRRTLPRRGYRFIYPVEDGAAAPAPAQPAQQKQPVPALPEVPEHVRPPALRPDDVAPPSLIGKTVSHYRVLGTIGSGGMGVVYGAEDIRLGRQVALKFLPDELADNPQALERFEREARAASTLNHPNICTIREVEDHEGKPFIVMELLEGRTLRERLAANTASTAGGAGSALRLDELLALGIQIADGLEAAHRKGIIHRDIKPANIFITAGGQAKILDFGLAKLTESVFGRFVPHTGDGLSSADQDTPTASLDVAQLTRPDAMMGTAAYMSPEQIWGEKVDARTDLFSFGLVLYEMATGRRAFQGATTAVVHDAILNRTPVPITNVNPQLPSRREETIDKALEKDRDLRYHSAGDLGADLRRLRRETTSGRAIYDRSEQGAARRTTSRQSRWRFAVSAAALIIVGILAFLFRPVLPPPRVTGSTQLTKDGREKEFMVTDGSRIFFSSFSGYDYSLLEASTAGGDTVPFPTSIPNAPETMLSDISPDRSELLVLGCTGGC